MLLNEKELLEKSPLAIVVSDHQDRIIWCNKRLLNTIHCNEEQVIGKLFPALPFEPIDKDSHLVQLFTNQVKEESRFHYWQSALNEPKGSKVHYFAEQRKNTAKISIALTKLGRGQLPKKADWVEFLNYEVSRSRRYNNPLSILKIHLLVLEKPNNVAEETLHQTIKDTLMDELRWADMISHTDQGTYLLVLPETPQESLGALKNKINAALIKKFEFISENINYQLVFGKASWQKHDDSQLLLTRARENLVNQLESLLN